MLLGRGGLALSSWDWHGPLLLLGASEAWASHCQLSYTYGLAGAIQVGLSQGLSGGSFPWGTPLQTCSAGGSHPISFPHHLSLLEAQVHRAPCLIDLWPSSPRLSVTRVGVGKKTCPSLSFLALYGPPVLPLGSKKLTVFPWTLWSSRLQVLVRTVTFASDA